MKKMSKVKKKVSKLSAVTIEEAMSPPEKDIDRLQAYCYCHFQSEQYYSRTLCKGKLNKNNVFLESDDVHEIISEFILQEICWAILHGKWRSKVQRVRTRATFHIR